jgi:hypothetical protein
MILSDTIIQILNGRVIYQSPNWVTDIFTHPILNVGCNKKEDICGYLTNTKAITN